MNEIIYNESCEKTENEIIYLAETELRFHFFWAAEERRRVYSPLWAIKVCAAPKSMVSELFISKKV